MALALAGCATGPKPTPMQIAHACPGVPVQRPNGFTRAYIELASVRNRDLPDPLSELRTEPVDTQGVTGVLVEHQVPAVVSWDRCLDRECELKLQRTLLVTAELPRTTREPIVLSVLNREGTGEHSSMYVERAETRNQQPVTIDEHAERSSLVLTPYLLADDIDVQQLRACKLLDSERPQGSR